MIPCPQEKRVGTDSSVWIPVQLRSYAPSGSRSAAEAVRNRSDESMPFSHALFQPKVVVRCRFIAAAKLKPSESLKKKRAMEMTRYLFLVADSHESVRNGSENASLRDLAIFEKINSRSCNIQQRSFFSGLHARADGLGRK